MQTSLSTTTCHVCTFASLFTGKERDTESGLDYFGARYYGSSMGRWMSPDWADKPEAVPYSSLDNPQSLNLYEYVGNNPLSKPDLDGHGCPPLCGDNMGVISLSPGFLSSPYVQGSVKIGTGAGLVGTIAFGDAPGSAVGALMVVSGVMGGTSTAVSGVTDIVGKATNTDVSGATQALSATSNIPGLVTTVATGGNLKAGETAATLGNAASLATDPKGAVKNLATASDAVQTVKDTGGLVQRTITAVQNFLNPPPPPAPKPPSPPSCATAGACH